MLPYTSLLHRSTRESLGISLKGSVVVLDEAHNIIETVNSVHSAALAQPQIALALSHLSQYLARYRSSLFCSMLYRSTLNKRYRKFPHGHTAHIHMRHGRYDK